jgi:microcystin-dependent protein
LFIPNDVDWLALVAGLLQTFTFADSFVAQGSLTPQQTADAFIPMFDAFCFNQGVCRVIGEIVQYAGTTNPDSTRWLACDGSTVSIASYPDLYAVVGTTFGPSSGGNFTLPDLRGRVSVSSGTGPGLSARSTGDSFGEETHQLTTAELAAHVHSIGNSLLVGTQVPPPLDGLGPNPFPASSGSTGGDTPHNNIQPSLVFSFYIVALS